MFPQQTGPVFWTEIYTNASISFVYFARYIRRDGDGETGGGSEETKAKRGLTSTEAETRGDVGVGSRSGSDYYVVSCRGHNTGTKWVIYIPRRRRHTTRAAALLSSPRPSSTVRETDGSSQSREQESTWDQNHPSSLPHLDSRHELLMLDFNDPNNRSGWASTVSTQVSLESTRPSVRKYWLIRRSKDSLYYR